MTQPRKDARTSAMFKVFVKGDDGRWRATSFHASRQEAELTAYVVTNRRGVAARVML